MALNARQIKLYVDRVSIWKPDNVTTSGANKKALDTAYPATATYTNVACYHFSKTEVAQPTFPGRSNQDMIFTLDEFHFDAAQDVDDQYVLKLTTSGHPELGAYYIVMGGPKSRPARTRRNVNYRIVYARRTLAQPGMPAEA